MKIGDNAKIGANAVVLTEVEPDTTVVGVPGRAVKRAGERIRQSFELDQIHIPDPVSQEFCRLRAEIERLKSELKTYEEAFERIKVLCPDTEKDIKKEAGKAENEE
jgi:serine O-acetyltransferase